MDAMIPNAETCSEYSILPEVFCFEKYNKVQTRIMLITIPAVIWWNLAVNPKMELFPGRISFSM